MSNWTQQRKTHTVGSVSALCGSLYSFHEAVSPRAEFGTEATANLIAPWKSIFSALHSDSNSFSKTSSCFTYPQYC